MSKGKYASKRSRSSKSLILVLALVTLITATVGGTLAWLYDTTGKVENTFTVGDITIHLTETGADTTTGKKDYPFVPGQTLEKDPKVTVDPKSEDCYLFIKIKEANNTYTDANNNSIDIINWTVDTNGDGWTLHNTVLGNDVNYYYYYREVTTSDSEQEFPILVGDEVTVNHLVTKEMVPAITQNKPTLSFWAAAIQSEHLAHEGTETDVEFAFSQIDWPNET